MSTEEIKETQNIVIKNQKQEEELEQQLEDQDVVNDLLFGEIEFDHKEFKIDRLSHSQKKQQQYFKHLEKHTDKDFLKNKWKQRRDRVNRRLDGLSNEEKCEQRAKRKEEIQKEKENQMKGYESGIPLIIDNSFEQYMTFREVRSLAIQILQTTLAQKKNTNPFQINVCNVSDQLKSCMVSQQFRNLPLNLYSEDILEVERFKDQAQNMIYLSPDSDNELETVDASGKTIYIVGGLIDRTVKKWASFDRATSQGIKTARLPINQYLTDLTRRALNIDTVTIMMGLAVELNFDWKTATLTILGNRKIKEDLKEEQKEIAQQIIQKYNETILDQNNMARDILKSIQVKEKKKVEQTSNQEDQSENNEIIDNQTEQQSNNQIQQQSDNQIQQQSTLN